jgi:hypothetical protein
MDDHDLVVADCSSALALNSSYTKVLMRRCQSYEAQEKYDEALSGWWDTHYVHHKRCALIHIMTWWSDAHKWSAVNMLLTK